MEKVWITLIFAATIFVFPNIAEDEKIPQKLLEKVKTWPKIFVLSPDPNYPVVCYSGLSLNFNNTKNETGAPSPVDKNDNQTVFSLSSDPVYPVTCRVGQIPEDLQDGNYITLDEDSANGTNITCIRRDYEKDVSAIFLHKAGPIQLAWNLFNSTIPYGFMTVDKSVLESISTLKVLNTIEVDCEKYGFSSDDKGGINCGAAASLCG